MNNLPVGSRRRRFINNVSNGLSRLLRVDAEQPIVDDFVVNVYHNPSDHLVTERQDDAITADNPRLRELRRLVLLIPRALRTHLSTHPMMARVRELIAELRAEGLDHIEEFINDIINS